MPPSQVTTCVRNSLLNVAMDPGEDIVISGISGRFPQSDNLNEFRSNLMNKVDMVANNGPRWILDHPEVPQLIGKVNNLEKFDAGFFDCNFIQAHTMDPQGRLLLEHAYEAIVDAGVNPHHLKNTKTGVFVGSCFSESEYTWVYQKHEGGGIGMLESFRTMLANRISQWLELKGPSYNIDSACSASHFAMEHAYTAIRNGVCDAALVCGANLCLHPNVSTQFFHLGVLSSDGRSKSFDSSANGYVRSETIAVAFIQKAKDAKRIYATVIHAKTNCDGYTSQGVTFPSSDMQRDLLVNLYEECRVSPSSVAYVEAHGTGTRVGDPEEANAIASVFCPGRTEPMLIGAVKSNIGHAEGASGIGQICKVIIAYEIGQIPPNLHFKKPRDNIPALVDGRMKVITETTPWNGGYVGISSFGFGGANAHVLLNSNNKEKINGGLPEDDIPRLILASGRTKDAVDAILTDVESRAIDVEYIRLLHDLHEDKILRHPYRGYTIVDKAQKLNIRDIKHYSEARRPVWYVFSGAGSRWRAVGQSLFQFPVFVNAINKCDAVLRLQGVDLYEILNKPNAFDSVFSTFVGVVAVQIALIDLLSHIQIVPDGIIGHSFGELSCAYADGCLTAEQTILAAYSSALTLLEAKMIPGAMAAVNLNYQQLKNPSPADIEVVRHNDYNRSTISEPLTTIKTFIDKLITDNLSVQEIPCENIGYHSKYRNSVETKLLARLKEIIPAPKARSSKWISICTSLSSSALPKLACAEYFTSNLLSPVSFQDAAALIPKSAVIIDLTPRSLQDVLKKSWNPEEISISLMKSGYEDAAQVFLEAVGELYMAGLQPAAGKLYPAVKYPVSRGTPMISPLVKWDHSEDWFVNYHNKCDSTSSGQRYVKVSLADEEFQYMEGHLIDGKILLPATGYLVFVWETLDMMIGFAYPKASVTFEDINFLKATTLSQETIELSIMIQRGTGRFEINENGVVIVTGIVRIVPDGVELVKLPISPGSNLEELSCNDVYKEFRIRGYQYSDLFRSIQSAALDGTRGTVRWHDNWVAFLDNMLQLRLLQADTRSLVIPTKIDMIVINLKDHHQQIESMSGNERDIPVHVNIKHEMIWTEAIQIRGLQGSAIARRKPIGNLVLESYKFVAHRDRADMKLKEAIHLATHISVENNFNIQIKAFEFLGIEDNSPPEELFSYHILDVLENIPRIQSYVNIITRQTSFKEEELSDNIKIIDPTKSKLDNDALILTGRNLLGPEKSTIMTQLLSTLKDGGFVFTLATISSEQTEQSSKNYGLQIILEKVVNGHTFWLLRKMMHKVPTFTSIIQMKKDEFTWIDELKTAQKEALNRGMVESSRVLLVSDGTTESGLLGLVNCLCKEPGGEMVRGVLIQDQCALDFSPSASIYAEQLKLDLAINVLKPGRVWGSYRHLPLQPLTPTGVYHAWADQLLNGNLNSFCWLEGAITARDRDPDLINVIYSSLNFRDIMIATGKLKFERFTKPRTLQERIFGFEYAGVMVAGPRVMGIVAANAVTNILRRERFFTWTVPESWTLEQAATVPSAYLTGCYAFYYYGKMKKGEKVLIHAGSGAVGQAAIYLALSSGCEIFTTVGTLEKRAFIRSTFPQIPNDHIGNSRDTSFEQMVMDKTNGRGVDMVLNSLADDKLQASVRCLTNGGRFLEIGKFDMYNNSSLAISAFAKGISFYSIMVDRLFMGSDKKNTALQELMQKLLDSGAIKPINYTIFSRDEIERAVRYMAAGKHIGKVILRIQDEKSPGILLPARQRYQCRKDRSYIILGGLGGFGLELADWLIFRGARCLIVTSRSGVKNGYQRMRLKLWKSYGVKVILVSGKDASNAHDCQEILTIALNQAPVDAIYNLAVVLWDNFFQNQTVQTFEESFKSKAWSTRNLDQLSRKMCPELRHFVVFSSVSCGRGNSGQTNYGMANSIMENICEKRVAEGFPALAIQWGAVGDVGLVADMQDNKKDIVIGGTLQQRITSCLDELDGFLNQKCTVVASMVVAEKRGSGNKFLNIVETVVSIMGIKDSKSIGQHTPLAEAGVDSMVTTEIQQMLERQFEISLTPQDIRSLTFAKLTELDAKESKKMKKNPTRLSEEQVVPKMKMWLSLLKDEASMKQTCMELPTRAQRGSQTVFLIPGVEGYGAIFTNIAKGINGPATCLQLNNMGSQYRSIPEIANELIPYIEKINQAREDFVLVGHSYGGLLALEIVRRLEAEQFSGRVVLIDSSPLVMKTLRDSQLPEKNPNNVQTHILVNIADSIAPGMSREFSQKLMQGNTWEEKLDVFMEYVPADALKISPEQQKNLCTNIYNRIDALDRYDITGLPPIRSPVTLLKSAIAVLKNLPEDYGLSQVTNGKVMCHTLDGDHVTILNNPELICAINEGAL